MVKRRVLTPELAEQLKQLWNEPISQRELLERIGLSNLPVLRFAYELGLEYPRGMVKSSGRGPWFHRLNGKIVQGWNDGECVAAIAAANNVSRQTVYTHLQQAGVFAKGDQLRDQVRQLVKERDELRDQVCSLENQLVLLRAQPGESSHEISREW